MPSEFKIVRRVEFSETDMAGIVHFSNYFRYMEHAEHAFFRSLGTSVADAASGVGWPRVHASCEYKQPLRFEDEVEIHLLVREVKERSIACEFVFRRVAPQPAAEVARGKLVIACVTRDAEGRMKPVSIPEGIRSKFQAT